MNRRQHDKGLLNGTRFFLRLPGARLDVVVGLLLVAGAAHGSQPGAVNGKTEANPTNAMFTCRVNEASVAFDELWHQGGPRVLVLSHAYWRREVPVPLRFQAMAAHYFVEKTATGLECRVLWAKNGSYAIMGEQAPDKLLAEIRTNICSSNLTQQLKGCVQSAALNDPRVVGLLLKAAQNADTVARKNVIDRLRDVGWRNVFVLGESFTNEVAQDFSSMNPTVRSRAFAVLEVTDGDVRWFLVEKALETTNVDVRCAAVEALGNIHEARAVTLLERATESSDADEYKAAITALGKVGNEAHVPVFEKALNDARKDYVISYAAIEALGRVGGDKACVLLEKTLLATKKQKELRYINTGAKAALALADMGGERAMTILNRNLESDDINIPRAVVFALGCKGGKKGMLTIEKALRGKDIQMRIGAAAALAKVGGEKELPLIENTLHDKWPGVRANAVRALGRIGGEKSCALLETAASDDDHAVRWEVAQSLGRVGGAKAIEALGRLLADSDTGVRGYAVTALANIGGDRARDLLCARLVAEPDSDEGGYEFDSIVRNLKNSWPDDPVAMKIMRETVRPHA